MLNSVVVGGRLTKDPESRSLQDGTPYVRFCVACERDYQKPGERQTDFIDCVAWRQTAEFVSKYFQTGSMIAVTGRLQLRKWQAQDGTNRTSWEIVVSQAYFGESRRREEQSSPTGSYWDQQYGPNGNNDDGLPF